MEFITAVTFPVFLAFVGRLPAEFRTIHQRADWIHRTSGGDIPMPGSGADHRVENHMTAHWMVLLAISLWAAVFMNETFSSLILPDSSYAFRMNLLVFICCLHLVLYLLIAKFMASVSLGDQARVSSKERKKNLESIRRVNALGVVVLGLFFLLCICLPGARM